MPDKDYDELTVTIPLPNYIPRARGIYGTASKMAGNIRVRVSEMDAELIDEVIEPLGMKRSSFIRFCAVKVAEELKKRQEK